MTQYSYVKASPQATKSQRVLKPSIRRHTAIVTKALFISGMLLIASVLMPILYYELFTAPKLKKHEFLSPVPASSYQTFNQESKTEKNFIRPQNWFPKAQFPEKTVSKITHYTLSIPKFKIKDATVEVNGEDLKESLIHYPGSALPGEVGATVIFGHSILPQFFNPENYLAIFSLIPTLDLGDEIIVKFDGITYTYRVMDKVEVKPDNISVLEQPYDNEYLRLITCTPPGTYLRRGVITAALVD
jgi:sortase A